LLKPGAYNIQVPLRYYESIAGVDELPNAAATNRFLYSTYGAIGGNRDSLS
jgi:hypothetical protein